MPAPLWLPLAVPRALRAGRIEVFHGTNHMAPPLAPVPTVITVHDLSALWMPAHHTWRNRLLTVPQMLLSLHRAARLIAVSSCTARDLAGLPGVDPSRIRVIPEAPAPELKPPTPDAVKDLVRRLSLPRTFLLYLGDLAAALRSLLDDEELRARLRAAGPVRARRFSWERTAHETLAVYREAAAQQGWGVRR